MSSKKSLTWSRKYDYSWSRERQFRDGRINLLKGQVTVYEKLYGKIAWKNNKYTSSNAFRMSRVTKWDSPSNCIEFFLQCCEPIVETILCNFTELKDQSCSASFAICLLPVVDKSMLLQILILYEFGEKWRFLLLGFCDCKQINWFAAVLETFFHVVWKNTLRRAFFSDNCWTCFKNVV